MIECERCAAIHYTHKFYGGEKPIRPIQRVKHVSTYTWWDPEDCIEKHMNRWLCDFCAAEEKEGIQKNPPPIGEKYSIGCAFKALKSGMKPYNDF